jgi:outer membrane protein TolC
MKQQAFAIYSTLFSALLTATVVAGNTATPTTSNKAKSVEMSLPEAVAFALKKNADVKSAYLQRVLDKFTLALAKDNYRIQPSFSFDTITTQLPQPFSRASDKQFGVTPGLTWDTPFSTQFAFSWSNTLSDGNYGNSASFTVTQPLLKGFGSRIAEAPLDDALDQEIIAKLNLRQTLISTITSVISDYRGVQQAEMTLTNVKRTLVNNQQHLHQDELRVKSGDLAETELAQDKFQVAQQKVQIGSTLVSIRDARLKLSNDLGLDDQIKIIVPTTIEIPRVTPNKALSEKIILAQNIQYQEALLGLKRDKRALLQARDNARWNLSLSATAARTSSNFSGGNEDNPNIPYTPSSQTVIDNSQVSLNLTVPLGKQRLQNKQAIAEARITISNDLIKLKQQKLTLLNQVDDQIERIHEDLSNIVLAEQALALQKATLEVTKKKIQYGMTSNFELFSQQTAYDSAEQALIQNKITYLNDLASFDQLLGTTLATWHVDVKY